MDLKYAVKLEDIFELHLELLILYEMEDLALHTDWCPSILNYDHGKKGRGGFSKVTSIAVCMRIYDSIVSESTWFTALRVGKGFIIHSYFYLLKG